MVPQMVSLDLKGSAQPRPLLSRCQRMRSIGIVQPMRTLGPVPPRSCSPGETERLVISKKEGESKGSPL